MGWTVIKQLGEGSFGSVCLARSSPSAEDDDISVSLNLPSLVAIKSAEFPDSDPLQFEREIFGALQDCPNIIRCYGADASYDEEGRIMYNLFLEYAAGGDLCDRIHSNSSWRFDEQEIRDYTRSLLQGLKHIHCDIKPENILLVADQDTAAGYTAKIADLGLTLVEELSDEAVKTRGSLPYLAPESILYGDYGSWVDIWALGCTVFEMLVGERLRNLDADCDWEAVEEMAKQEVHIPSGLSSDARDFLPKCLEDAPMSRWSADKLLKEHPFVRESHVDNRGIADSLDRDEWTELSNVDDDISSEQPMKLLKRYREEHPSDIDLFSDFCKRPKLDPKVN